MPRQPRIRSHSPRAFTLVEVLISIAIALLLIIGISQIFAIAQRTTSMGTSLLVATAQDRSIQNTLTRDFKDMLPLSNTSSSPPPLVIASYAAAAFRNRSDFDGAIDVNDPTNFGPSFTSTAPQQAFSTNYRIHRLDRLGFFARDVFTRQTADAPALVSSTTSNEAFIWYGHLALPNNAAISAWDPANPDKPGSSNGAWYNPGAPDITPGTNANDNNRFASSFILGRAVTLLLPRTSGPLPESGYTAAGNSRFPLFLFPSGFVPISQPGVNGGAAAPIYASRYDVCYASISDWNTIITKLASRPPLLQIAWWWQGLDGLPTDAMGNITATAAAPEQRYYGNPFPTKNANFNTGNETTWNSAAAAQTAPIFVRGCSQFIVEFAGDFTTQDPITGVQDPTHAGQPDGQIDFIVDRNDNNVPPRRHIRWYGLPRDIATTANPGGVQPDGTLDVNDVVPVSTYTGTPWAFERSVPTITLPTTSMPLSPDSNMNNLRHGPAYVCAWGPGDRSASTPRPQLIRITIAVDDANGRLNNEQTYEYVFAVP